MQPIGPGEHQVGELVVQDDARIQVVPTKQGTAWKPVITLEAHGRLGRGKHKPLRFELKGGVILVRLLGRFSQATVLDIAVFEQWLEAIPVMVDSPDEPLREVNNRDRIAEAREAVRTQVYGKEIL